jgi:predicted DNA-binding transcriptional regulator YafY
MNFVTHLKKIETIRYWADRKQTGTLQQLAHRLDVSQRTAQRLVHELREMGTPIIYNRFRNTYELDDSERESRFSET